MELEALAVVWAIGQYRAYLYGHNVTVIDCSAIRAVLGATDLSGRHEHWCAKVYDNGTIDIVYRCGKENINSDALSRIPLLCPEQAIPLQGQPFC